MKFFTARQAIHDAYAIHVATPDAGNSGSRTGAMSATAHNKRVADLVDAGKIVSVVEALTPEVRHWLYFCYGPACNYYMQSAWNVAGTLWEIMQVEAGEAGRVRPGKMKAISALCMIAAQDYQAKILRGSLAHSPGRVAELLNLSPDHFRRDYGPWILRMDKVMAGWDEIGLIAVGDVVWEERRKAECA